MLAVLGDVYLRNGCKSVMQKRHMARIYLQGIIFATVAISLVWVCCNQFVVASQPSHAVLEATSANLGMEDSIMTLQVTPISPQNGGVLTDFPARLEIQVTRGGLPVGGAHVQFWMEGGTADAAMHNAGLAMTNSSGFAGLTLPNKDTLDAGQYVWYATAYKAGAKSASSSISFFVVPPNGGIGNKIPGGTVLTDKAEYQGGQENGIRVKIYGTVNHYHLGQPIVIKISLPKGRQAQMVSYGTYLGAFQTTFYLGAHPDIGSYLVNVYHDNYLSAEGIFRVVR